DLDAIVLPIAHVNHAVFRDLHAAEGVELLRRLTARIVRAGIGVARLLAVCAPAALERAGIRVEDLDGVIAEAVGHEQLAAVDGQRARTVEAGAAVAALRLAALADLQQELSALVELHHLRIGRRRRAGWRTAATACRWRLIAGIGAAGAGRASTSRVTAAGRRAAARAAAAGRRKRRR